MTENKNILALVKQLQVCEFISDHECWRLHIGSEPAMCSHCQESLQYAQMIRNALIIAISALEEIKKDDFKGSTEPDYEEWENYMLSMETKRQLAILALSEISSL